MDKLYNFYHMRKHYYGEDFQFKDFEEFKEFAKSKGYKRGYQLARIDKSKPFNKDNCIFILRKALNYRTELGRQISKFSKRRLSLIKDIVNYIETLSVFETIEYNSHYLYIKGYIENVGEQEFFMNDLGLKIRVENFDFNLIFKELQVEFNKRNNIANSSVNDNDEI